MGLDTENWGLRDYYAGVEDPNVRYVIILVAGQGLPLAVVRLTGTVEEAFTHNLRWEPSTLLSRVPSEPTWTARDANVGYANGFLVEMVRVIRAQTNESELTDYKYYASFKDTLGVLDLDSVDRLIRRSEGSAEEEYAGHDMWESSDKLYRIDFGHDTYEDYVALSGAEAGRLKKLIDDRWDRGCHHYIVSVDNRPVAVVVKVANNPDAEVGELAFTGDPEPQPSRLLEQSEREPRMHAVRTTMAAAVQMMAALTRIRRLSEQATLTGGYAVFQRPTDVLDLDSATDIVGKVKRHHEIAVPVSTSEAEILIPRLYVRDVRRSARSIDGHFYFAVFATLKQVGDHRTAYSVIRVPVDGTRRWEMFLRKGEWLRTRKPSKLHTLPLAKSDLKSITRRLEATGRRYFEIRGDRGRVALLRLTGTTEESSQGLGWEPSALLQRWQDEPAWVITEDHEQGMDMSRFYAARADRVEINKDSEYEYLAVFADFADAMDLGRAQMVVRRKDGVDERQAGLGQWVPTEKVAPTRVALPISQDEVAAYVGRVR